MLRSLHPDLHGAFPGTGRARRCLRIGGDRVMSEGSGRWELHPHGQSGALRCCCYITPAVTGDRGKNGSPDGDRTRFRGVKIRDPRPMDDRAMRRREDQGDPDGNRTRIGRETTGSREPLDHGTRNGARGNGTEKRAPARANDGICTHTPTMARSGAAVEHYIRESVSDPDGNRTRIDRMRTGLPEPLADRVMEGAGSGNPDGS